MLLSFSASKKSFTHFSQLFWQLASYHALFTLDHKAFVLVHSTDATDDVVVLVMGPSTSVVVVALVTLQRIRAVGLAGRLAHDLINLDSGFVTSAVVGFPQPAHVPAYRWLPAIIFLEGKKKTNTFTGFTANFLYNKSHWKGCIQNCHFQFSNSMGFIGMTLCVLPKQQEWKGNKEKNNKKLVNTTN